MNRAELLNLRKEAIKRKEALWEKRRAMSFEEKINELEDIIEWIEGFKIDTKDKCGNDNSDHK